MRLKPAQMSPLHAFRMFSSAADASQRRRPTDVLLLVGALFLIFALTANAPGPSSVDESVAALLGEMDRALSGFWPLAYTVLLAWGGVVVVAPVMRFRDGRLRLLWDYAVAFALSVVAATVVGVLAGTDIETSLAALLSTDTGPVYVPSRLAVVTALLAAASPHLTRPFRMVGRLVVTLGAAATVALGLSYASGALAGVAVGVAAATAVHLLRGSPGGLLTPDQVREALLDLGVIASSISSLPPTAPGEQRMHVEAEDGALLLVKVMGRDAWDAQYIGSLWASLTRRGEPPRLTSTRRERVQHEAMVTLLAERAGVPVLPVVTAGQGMQGEAMVVTGAPARTLGDVSPEDVTDDTLAGAWTALVRLHEQGIAHLQITAEHVVVPDGGDVAWSDLGGARVAPSTTDMMLDRVHLLVTTWLLVGEDRAVDAATQVLGRGELAQTVPYLVDPALSPVLRRAVGTDHDLADLRAKALASAATHEAPTVELRRVTGVSLLKMLLVVVVASTLIGLLAGVDVAEIVDELREANWALLVLAIVVAPLAQVAFSFSTIGATVRKLPYLPVLVLQYAIQFMALVLPSTGARVALQIRFFERIGVPYGAAMSMGMIDGISGFVVQGSLLLLITLSSLPGVTTSVQTTSGGEQSSSDPPLLMLALVIALLWGVATVAIPRRRARAKRAIPRYEEALKGQAIMARSALGVVKHPGKLAMMMGGNLGGQVIQAVVLGLCLSAFGQSASLSQLILVNTFVSLFAGIMPVPGGVGVAEAGYAYGLQAVGVPSAAAVSTAIAFRLVTFYLPPLWGSFAMRWLRKNAYV